MNQTLIFIATVLSLSACSGSNPISVGQNSTVAEVENPAENPVRTGAALTDYAASWDGYVEAYQFPSGSERVRITLDDDGQGTMEFGDAPLLPPPTDPDVGYALDVNSDGTVAYHSGVQEGFRYTALGARVNDMRIQVGADQQEIYKVWCELQTPHAWHDGGPEAEFIGYGCLPNSASATGPDGCYVFPEEEDENMESWEPIDCGKLLLCTYVGETCDCDAESCSLPPLAEEPSETSAYLDGALEDDGETLVGTLVLGFERMTVRLTRE